VALYTANHHMARMKMPMLVSVVTHEQQGVWMNVSGSSRR
jgi:hypothetical protein